MTNEPMSQTAIQVPAEQRAASRPGCVGWFVREGRLRSGWRMLLYVITARVAQLIVAFLFAAVIAVVLVLFLAPSGVSPEELNRRLLDAVTMISGLTPLGLALRAVDTLLVLAVVWLFRRFIDKRSFQSLGFQLSFGWWREVLAGFGLIILAWAVIFVATLGFGAAVITGVSWTTTDAVGILAALAGGLIINIFVGITEEADARGYMLQNLAEGIKFFPAVLVSSLYFGLLHLLNPGAGIGSTLGIFFAGVLLAMGYYATGRLWFPIGMHAAWNFAEGPLFGFLVSGLNMGGLFHLRITGPDWLMGGGFGPEAGALAVVVEIVLSILLFVWGKRRANGATYRGVPISQ